MSLGGPDGACGVHLVRLRGEQRLVGFDADGHLVDFLGAEVGPGSVEEDGASGRKDVISTYRNKGKGKEKVPKLPSIDHVRLKQHLVQPSVLVHGIPLRSRQVQAPIDDAGIGKVDGRPGPDCSDP